MKNGSRANALLMELLIVILFFMLAAVALIQVFGLAHQRSGRARAVAAAVLEAQNVAEALYDADDPGACLAGLGFEKQGDVWTREEEAYFLRVTEEYEEAEAGRLRVMNVEAGSREDVFLTLPSVRYLEKEAAT